MNDFSISRARSSIDAGLSLRWTVNEQYKFVSLDDSIERAFKYMFGVKPNLNQSMIDTLSTINICLAERWRKLYELAKLKGSLTIEEMHREDERVSLIQYDLTTAKISKNGYLITAVVNEMTDNRQQFVVPTNVALASIFENAESPMWVIDLSGKLVRKNKSFSAFQKSFLKTDVRDFSEFTADIEDALIRQKWQSRCEGVLNGQSESFVESVETNGSVTAYRVVMQPVIENNQIIGGTFVAYNISAQVNQENLIRSQNERLKKLTHQFQKLLYSASHDLRGPVATAKGLINLIKLEYSKENIATCLEHMHTALDKLELAVREIAQFASINKTRIKNEVVNIHTLIKEVIRDLSSLDGFDRIDFVIKARHEDMAVTDPRKLKLILSNIITNSIQFQDNNKSSYVIIYAKLKGKGQISIEVIDNGVGIPEDQLEKIFDMFHKATPTNSGAGLGLFIAREAALALGGTIKVFSSLGHGTRFKIDLASDIIKR